MFLFLHRSHVCNTRCPWCMGMIVSYTEATCATRDVLDAWEWSFLTPKPRVQHAMSLMHGNDLFLHWSHVCNTRCPWWMGMIFSYTETTCATRDVLDAWEWSFLTPKPRVQHAMSLMHGNDLFLHRSHVCNTRCPWCMGMVGMFYRVGSYPVFTRIALSWFALYSNYTTEVCLLPPSH